MSKQAVIAVASESEGKRKHAPNLRQSMTGVHLWVGLLAGWILYAIFMTGGVSYFRDEISRYLRPEIPMVLGEVARSEVLTRVLGNLSANERAQNVTQWFIQLPTEREPWVQALWRKGKQRESALFDAQTGESLEAVRETRGGDFFYRFHFNLHYMPTIWGRWIVGICTMMMLVALITGVIVHKRIFADFFTFRSGKRLRSWLDGHNVLSVLGLPFHLMITYSGLLLLAMVYMPWGQDVAAKQAQTPVERRALMASSEPRPSARTGIKASLTTLEPLVRQAEARWGSGSVGRIVVQNPNDLTARVLIRRNEQHSMTRESAWLLFDGVNGQLLEYKSPQEIAAGAATRTRGVLQTLHVGRFADSWTRGLYFVLSLMGAGMVATGLVMWTVKRRARGYFVGLRVVESLNIAGIAGLSAAMAAFFWANRLLPLEWVDRANWEIHSFFAVWFATLVYAVCVPVQRAWWHILSVAAVLLLGIPVVNGLTTERDIWYSVSRGDGVFIGVELLCVLFGVGHAWLAWYLKRYPWGGFAKNIAKPAARRVQSRTEKALA